MVLFLLFVLYACILSAIRKYTQLIISLCTVYDLVIKHPNPDNKVHEDNMGPTWGPQDPGGPHVFPMSLAILEELTLLCTIKPELDKRLILCRLSTILLTVNVLFE